MEEEFVEGISEMRKNEEPMEKIAKTMISWAENWVKNNNGLPSTDLPYYIRRSNEYVYIGKIIKELPVSVVVRDENNGEITSIEPPVILRDVAVEMKFWRGKYVSSLLRGIFSTIWHPHVGNDRAICTGNLDLSSLILAEMTEEKMEKTFRDLETLLTKVSTYSWYGPKLGQSFFGGGNKEEKEKLLASLKSYKAILDDYEYDVHIEERDGGYVVKRG